MYYHGVSVSLVGPFDLVIRVFRLENLHRPHVVRLAEAHGVAVDLQVLLLGLEIDAESTLSPIHLYNFHYYLVNDPPSPEALCVETLLADLLLEGVVDVGVVLTARVPADKVPGLLLALN